MLRDQLVVLLMSLLQLIDDLALVLKLGLQSLNSGVYERVANLEQVQLLVS